MKLSFEVMPIVEEPTQSSILLNVCIRNSAKSACSKPTEVLFDGGAIPNVNRLLLVARYMLMC